MFPLIRSKAFIFGACSSNSFIFFIIFCLFLYFFLYFFIIFILNFYFLFLYCHSQSKSLNSTTGITDPRYPLRIDLRHNHSLKAFQILQATLDSTTFLNKENQERARERENRKNEEAFLGTRTTGRNTRLLDGKFVTNCFVGKSLLFFLKIISKFWIF